MNNGLADTKTLWLGFSMKNWLFEVVKKLKKLLLLMKIQKLNILPLQVLPQE
jgi:hypothetical protein